MEQGHPPATMAFTDRRWTIMAALLGSNTAVMLVHGLQQEMNPSVTREFALTLIAVTLPFQAVYFMIHTYADSFAQNLGSGGTADAGAPVHRVPNHRLRLPAWLGHPVEQRLSIRGRWIPCRLLLRPPDGPYGHARGAFLLGGRTFLLNIGLRRLMGRPQRRTSWPSVRWITATAAKTSSKFGRKTAAMSANSKSSVRWFGLTSRWAVSRLRTMP